MSDGPGSALGDSIQAECVFERADHSALLRYRRRGLIERRGLLVLGGACLVALGMFVPAAQSWMSREWPVEAFLLLPFGGAVGSWAVIKLYETLRDAWLCRVRPLGRVRTVFSPQGFALTWEGGSVDVPWTNVEHVAEIRDHIFIQCPATVYCVPRRGFESPATCDALLARMAVWANAAWGGCRVS